MAAIFTFSARQVRPFECRVIWLRFSWNQANAKKRFAWNVLMNDSTCSFCITSKSFVCCTSAEIAQPQLSLIQTALWFTAIRQWDTLLKAQVCVRVNLKKRLTLLFSWGTQLFSRDKFIVLTRRQQKIQGTINLCDRHLRSLCLSYPRDYSLHPVRQPQLISNA